MARNNRRRNRISNRRLPTIDATYHPRSYTLSDLHRALGLSSYYDRSELYAQTYPVRHEPAKRRLAKIVTQQQKPNFPKTYGVATPKLTKQELKVLDVCESRREREQVLHANNKTGKSGQKSPIWTRKSKIKC